MGIPLLGELAVRGCKGGCSAEKAGGTRGQHSCLWALESEAVVCCTDGRLYSFLCSIKMKEKLNLIKIQQFKAFCKLVCNVYTSVALVFWKSWLWLIMSAVRLETKKPGLVCFGYGRLKKC